MKREPQVRLLFEDDEIGIDGFAGGGGASTGIEMALGRSPDIAINHDPEALAMHATNHPTTVHYPSNIHDISFKKVCRGKRVAFGWFSPDCTYHSKARGGKPFRDPVRARRIRGLSGVVVKCAEQVRPRVLFMENVEEFRLWGPLGEDGLPDPTRRGMSFNRWVARLRNIGYAVEWRELRACDFGAPTMRKRLFVIARCDGRPIVWPKASHGPTRKQAYRTAAECIDFTLPVPSIFWTQAQAKKWAKALGVPAPHRPLALATQRRIARGVMRYVLNAADPFIIPVLHQGDDRVHSVHEPLRTITTSERGEFALVTPFLAQHTTGSTGADVREPMRTVVAAGVTQALVVPTLINTRNGERSGQAPRIMDINAPLNTVTAQGSQGALVAAFLAKHNGGHEATGQKVTKPMDTVVCRENKALVTSHLLKLYGTSKHGATVGKPMPTITAHGNHIAEVRAFLVKFYGSKKDGRPLFSPLDTITTKERFGICTVTIAGEEYAIVDIGMRMLTPRELFRAQGFPGDYRIESTVATPFRPAGPLTKRAQTRLVGNSVAPHVAAAIVRANLSTAVPRRRRRAA